jgi:hypothetical protein
MNVQHAAYLVRQRPSYRLHPSICFRHPLLGFRHPLLGFRHRYLVSDTRYLVSDAHYLVSDIRYFVINPMREVQDLCRRHQCLLLRQSVQPLQRVFDVLPPHKLLEEFL